MLDDRAVLERLHDPAVADEPEFFEVPVRHPGVGRGTTGGGSADGHARDSTRADGVEQSSGLRGAISGSCRSKIARPTTTIGNFG